MKSYQLNKVWVQLNLLLPKVFQIQANNLPIEETTLKQLLQYTYEFIKTINK